MKRVAAVAALVIFLAVPSAALAHGKNASHDGCRAEHGIRFDGYISGRYWYHSMSYQGVLAVWDQQARHYYRQGPPSNPVYVYSHTTWWTCFG